MESTADVLLDGRTTSWLPLQGYSPSGTVHARALSSEVCGAGQSLDLHLFIIPLPPIIIC